MSAPFPPGPSGAELIKTAINLTRGHALLPELMRATAAHGDVVRFKLPRVDAFLLNDPEAARHVLLENARGYVKGHKLEELRPVVGNGLLTSEGDFWLRQRRLAQPAFNHARISGLADTMLACIAQEEPRWEARAASGLPFDVCEVMSALTLEIVGQTLFSVSLTGEAGNIGASLIAVMRHASRRARSFLKLPRFIPTPAQRRFEKGTAALAAVVDEIIARRRGAPEGDDLLAMLLAARDEDGRAMSDAQLRDEATTLLLAGHETTANALSWTFLLLSRFPAVARKVAEEVAQVTGDRALTGADVMKLAYTRQVVQEGMRLYPPAWLVHREPLQDDVVAGYRVPKGSLVLISPFLLHRNAKHWENPEGFDPDRFTPEAMKARARFSYLPFGGGPRICIGNEFALMEAALILASVVRRWRLELVSSHPVELEPVVTLRPRYGLQMVAARRSALTSKQREELARPSTSLGVNGGGLRAARTESLVSER